MPDAIQTFHDDTPFEFRKGGVLPQLTHAYETWGELNADRSNGILILTGLSPGTHAASSAADSSPGWWSQ